MPSKMCPRLISLIIVLVFCISLQSAETAKGYYTIIAPGTIRSLSSYHLAITLSNYSQSCAFNISIFGDGGNYWSIHNTFEVEPATTNLLEIKAPVLHYGEAFLRVTGIRGIISNSEARLAVEENHYSVFIQTNKPKYQPGETVEFRVICVDRLTQPVHVKMSVAIFDSQKNLINEFFNISQVQGVFKKKFPLSNYPVLGEWAIEARSRGHTLQRKTIEVSKYTLPTFSVNISTINDLSSSDKVLPVTLKAKYSHGKTVKGNLTLNINAVYDLYNNFTSEYTKQVDINGETTIYIDLKSDLKIESNTTSGYFVKLFDLEIEATVQDSLTWRKVSAKKMVSIHAQPFNIAVNTSKLFNPAKLVNITMTVTDLQHKPIVDITGPAKIIIKAHNKELNEGFTQKSNRVHLDTNGVGFAVFNLSREDGSRYEVYAEYRGWISHSIEIERIEKNTFKIEILTENPLVGKPLIVEISSIDPIGHFVYDIISRGDILESTRIDVPSDARTYRLRITPSYIMIPKITVFVHRVKDSIFDSALKDVYIKREFQNYITIQSDEEVLPHNEVSINISTTAGSYVGLMGIDESLLINSKPKQVLTEDEVFTELKNYDSLNMNQLQFPAIKAGLVAISNAHNRAGLEIGTPAVSIETRFPYPVLPIPDSFSKPTIEAPYIRNLFSESWLFDDFENVPRNGLSLHETAPDSITTWAISGFSLHSNTGLALSKNMVKLKVFQTFFISMDLPNFIIEDEVLELPIYIFNYLDKNLTANVNVDGRSENIHISENPAILSTATSKLRTSIKIPSQDKAKVIVFVKPLKPGSYKLLVTAIASSVSDGLLKILHVRPQGVPYLLSKNYLVHFLENGEKEDDISIDIPKDAVPESERISLTVVGDTFGPLAGNLRTLVRAPFGSGEENMNYFATSLMVFKYLQTLNYSNPSLANKARLYMQLGYQNQLAFKQLDGSFSLFDRTSEFTGDIWLTAYVMWGLQQAKHFIHVDTKIILRGLGYLKSKQNSLGAFPSGKDVENDVTVTAFALMAFLKDEKSQTAYRQQIAKGLDYLYEALNTTKHPRSVAMSTYVLLMGKHDKSEEALEKLKSNVELTDNKIMMPKVDSFQTCLETATTSFMVLIEAQRKPVQELLPIIHSLISGADLRKTPAQILALEAMTQFAQDVDLNSKDLNIHFSDDLGSSTNIFVNKRNSQIQQTVKFPKSTRKIRIQTSGTGFAIIYINYRYNMLFEKTSTELVSNFTVKRRNKEAVVFDICVSRLRASRTNITVVEINLQSGYTVDESTLEQIMLKNEHAKSVQLNGNEGSILAYFDYIPKGGTCIQLEVFQMYKVTKLRPLSVVAYDNNIEDQRLIRFYDIDSS